jgi:hypothetical protein
VQCSTNLLEQINFLCDKPSPQFFTRAKFNATVIDSLTDQQREATNKQISQPMDELTYQPTY